MRRFAILLLFCLAPFLASAEDFSVQIGSVRGFDRNPITIHSPVSGTLILSVEDVRSWTVEIPEGKSMIEWDGLGLNEEILPEGSYCMRAFLDCGNEQTLSTELSFRVGKCRNALLFALPKSDTLYAAGDPWACEMRTARRGSTIVTEFYRCDQPDQLLAAKRNKIESGTFITYTWDGRLDGRMAESGDYTEGWVPLTKLKVVYPHPTYALVIDKAEQTMTVWQQGEVLGSMPISTGLMARANSSAKRLLAPS